MIIVFKDLLCNFLKEILFKITLCRIIFIIKVSFDHFFMYSLELSLRYSPFPLSIQKKEFDDVKRIYDEIKSSMNLYLEKILVF